MKKTVKLFAALLALCMTLSLAAPAYASTYTDGHGNEIELDDSLEAYTEWLMLGGSDAARKAETNLGDFWTDALLWFATSGKINEFFEEDDVTAGNNKIFADEEHTVALWNGGNLRENIAVGKFGAKEIADVLPYPNTVSVAYMTGAQLVEALEAASQGLPYSEDTAAACASFMQVAGLKYTVDTTKAFDKGEVYKEPWYKVNSVGRVTVTEVNGKPLDESATYAVITSNANLKGMDSSYLFKAASEADERCAITTAVVRDVIWMYLTEKLENIVPESYAVPQGRISVRHSVMLTAQNLTVNGEAKTAEIYNIDGANYFKLRDMAALLTGTGSEFSVSYDAENKTVVIKTGEAYEKQAGDLEQGEDKSATAQVSVQTIQINGETVTGLTVYNIGGSKFFKLRELGEKLGFNVDYDNAARTMVVTSK